MVSCTICSSYETAVRLRPNAQLRHVKFEVVHAKATQKKMQILNTLTIFFVLACNILHKTTNFAPSIRIYFVTMIDTIINAALRAGRAIMNIYNHPDLDWQVERKADNSPLTLADRESHRVIAEALEATPYPLLSEEGAHLPYDERKDWHSLWIVDPLDGTKEFLKKNDEFTVNIALVTDGVPVMGVIYVPAKHQLFWGEKGQGAFTAEVDPETLHVGKPEALPLKGADWGRPFRVVASRSHLSPETETFITDLQRHHPDLEMVSAGSSLKLCLVAEGKADIYPRLAPTMEWDTAAGHAIALAAGKKVLDAQTDLPLTYNKEDLHNPWFVVK